MKHARGSRQHSRGSVGPHQLGVQAHGQGGERVGCLRLSAPVRGSERRATEGRRNLAADLGSRTLPGGREGGRDGGREGGMHATVSANSTSK